MKFKDGLLLSVLMSSGTLSYAEDLSLPSVCKAESLTFDQNLECTQKYFVINGQPINPMIIKDLSASLSDGGDQVVAINLLQSQNSNKYFHSGKFETKKHGKYYSATLEIPVESSGQSPHGIFDYDVEGVTQNGIVVIQTAENGGGTGTFYSLLFVRIRKDVGLVDGENGKIDLNHKRILIEKLGAITLGDRKKAVVKIEKNNVVIGMEDFHPASSGERPETKTISLENM